MRDVDYLIERVEEYKRVRGFLENKALEVADMAEELDAAREALESLATREKNLREQLEVL